MLLSSDGFRFQTPERVRNEYVHTFAYYSTVSIKMQGVFEKKFEIFREICFPTRLGF